MIRTAEVSDAPGIARAHVQSWHETYRGLIPDRMLAALSVERRTEAWEKVLREPAENNKLVVFVNEIGGQVVAFAACGKQRDHQLKTLGFDGEIESIYVLQAFQRKGIGAALMNAMAGSLVDHGYRGVALWVLRENSTARRFYQSCGGMTLAEKNDDRGVALLVEVAYGWSDFKIFDLGVKPGCGTS